MLINLLTLCNYTTVSILLVLPGINTVVIQLIPLRFRKKKLAVCEQRRVKLRDCLKKALSSSPSAFLLRRSENHNFSCGTTYYSTGVPHLF